MLPRGASVSVRSTRARSDRPAARDHASESGRRTLSYAGTDIARGETVLGAGAVLTSREIGCSRVAWPKFPFIAARGWRFSERNEIGRAGNGTAVGASYYSKAAIIGDAVEEQRRRAGAARPSFPKRAGASFRGGGGGSRGARARLQHDLVGLSGGYLKGAGNCP